MLMLPERRLRLENLAGWRGEKPLFAAVELTLSPGEIAELRGPNGAGKTTLLMIVAGIVRPAAGRVVIEGGDPELPPGRDISLLAHRPGLKPRLTVAENLRFWSALMGTAGDCLAALETVGLAAIAGLEAGHLSAGQTRRLALARLLLDARPLWLLDEPTAALDAAGEALVAELIDAHLDRGGLVLAATHHNLGIAHTAQRLELGAPVATAEAIW